MPKNTPAAEQFAALGLTDPSVWTDAMNLAVKQKWAGLPVDAKVDDLRTTLADLVTAPTPTAAILQAQGFGDAEACEREAARLKRNAKVQAWRQRNQLQAAIDARTLKFAALRGAKQPSAA